MLSSITHEEHLEYLERSKQELINKLKCEGELWTFENQITVATATQVDKIDKNDYIPFFCASGV